MNSGSERDVYEPDVLPPENEQGTRPSFFKRLEYAFGPIIAGIIIDTLDIATFGRFGIMTGMMIGGTAAFWLCSIYQLKVWQRFLWALAAGLYCTVPRTEFIPLATMIGAFTRFVSDRRK